MKTVYKHNQNPPVIRPFVDVYSKIKKKPAWCTYGASNQLVP